jgi:hypothetical protein
MSRMNKMSATKDLTSIKVHLRERNYRQFATVLPDEIFERADHFVGQTPETSVKEQLLA